LAAQLEYNLLAAQLWLTRARAAFKHLTARLTLLHLFLTLAPITSSPSPSSSPTSSCGHAGVSDRARRRFLGSWAPGVQVLPFVPCHCTQVRSLGVHNAAQIRACLAVRSLWNLSSRILFYEPFHYRPWHLMSYVTSPFRSFRFSSSPDTVLTPS
jgi:hypothetical protein